MNLFDAAESDPQLAGDQAKPLEAKLRAALLKAQYERVQKADRSLIIVMAGIPGAGKGAAASLLNEWMDARHIRTVALGEPSEEDKAFPYFRRYWQTLPAHGNISIIFESWHQRLFDEAARKKPDQAVIQAHAEAIRHFEAMLVREGIQIVKLWYHLSRGAQKQRTDELLANPDTAWQVGPEDTKVRKKFSRLRDAAALGISLTNADHAPWCIIPSADVSLRAITTGQAVLSALRRHSRVQSNPSAGTEEAPTVRPAIRLENLKYDATLDDQEYDEQLAGWQARLANLARSKKFQRLPLVLVFEGQDAAGKGGAIRRITHTLDARQFHAIPISAPTAEERAHPYLWRFWQCIPKPGHITIFDRSWYGRVLVERVEKYAKPDQWQRAYAEINHFEAQLHDSGALVLKFWLAITPEEQLKRFREREASPFKSFKITPEDWRNRKQWDAYAVAANDMFARTDTPTCPWHVLAANDKKHARVAVLEHIVKAVEQAL